MSYRHGGYISYIGDICYIRYICYIGYVCYTGDGPSLSTPNRPASSSSFTTPNMPTSRQGSAITVWTMCVDGPVVGYPTQGRGMPTSRQGSAIKVWTTCVDGGGCDIACLCGG